MQPRYLQNKSIRFVVNLVEDVGPEAEAVMPEQDNLTRSPFYFEKDAVISKLQRTQDPALRFKAAPVQFSVRDAVAKRTPLLQSIFQGPKETGTDGHLGASRKQHRPHLWSMIAKANMGMISTQPPVARVFACFVNGAHSQTRRHGCRVF